jgi:hypothetical protein
MNRWASLLQGAVSEEQIDEVLVGHALVRRHFLEVVHGNGVEPDRNLTLELLRVRALAGLGKIVLFSHRSFQ